MLLLASAWGRTTLYFTTRAYLRRHPPYFQIAAAGGVHILILIKWTKGGIFFPSFSHYQSTRSGFLGHNTCTSRGFWATPGEKKHWRPRVDDCLWWGLFFFFPAVKRCVVNPAPEDEQRMDIGQHSGSAFALLLILGEKQEDCVKSTA